MKKYLLLALLLLSFPVLAEDGRITFTGAVYTATCPVPDRTEIEQCDAGGGHVVKYSTEEVEVKTELTEYNGNQHTFTMTYE